MPSHAAGATPEVRSDAGAPQSPPGADLTRLTDWLDGRLPGLRTGPLRAEVIAGGRSNLTYRLSDGSHVWALRRPPLGHVLPSAHDMAREYTVIAALRGSSVPVPEAVALCTDREVLGEPFYLMGFVDGVVLDRPELLPDRHVARQCGHRLVDTLLALHAVDPAAAGLGEFGRPAGFLPRQLGRWHQQYQSSLPESRPAGAAGAPEEAEVVRRLDAGRPSHSAATVVHGDYRLTNVLFTADLRAIAAVVDWEMATLGDPLTDLGLLYVYHAAARSTPTVMADFTAAGLPDADELLRRYAAGTALDLDCLDWYIGFGYFKLGVIAAGIHARFRQGRTVGEGFERFGELSAAMLGEALSRLGGR